MLWSVRELSQESKALLPMRATALRSVRSEGCPDALMPPYPSIHAGRTNIAAGHKVKGDHNAKVRLAPTLAPDEVSLHRPGAHLCYCVWFVFYDEHRYGLCWANSIPFGLRVSMY
jgi:hypothetical protein